MASENCGAVEEVVLGETRGGPDERGRSAAGAENMGAVGAGHHAIGPLPGQHPGASVPDRSVRGEQGMSLSSS